MPRITSQRCWRAASGAIFFWVERVPAQSAAAARSVRRHSSSGSELPRTSRKADAFCHSSSDAGARSGAKQLSLVGHERAVILARDGSLRFGLNQAANPSVAGTEHQGSVSSRRQLLELERRSIVEALQKSDGKIGSNGAAELPGRRPTTLTSKIAALKMKRR